MEFWITIRHQFRNYKLKVQLIKQDERIEQYKVIGRNKYIVLENNRPFFRSKGLKHRKPVWKVVEGEIYYGQGIEQLIEAIMNQIEPDNKGFKM